MALSVSVMLPLVWISCSLALTWGELAGSACFDPPLELVVSIRVGLLDNWSAALADALFVVTACSGAHVLEALCVLFLVVEWSSAPSFHFITW